MGSIDDWYGRWVRDIDSVWSCTNNRTILLMELSIEIGSIALGNFPWAIQT